MTKVELGHHACSSSGTMFDNLFGFAGPLGTSFVLVALLFSVVALCMVAGRIPQLQGRARV